MTKRSHIPSRLGSSAGYALVFASFLLTAGMHMALLIAGGAFLIGCLLSLLVVQRGPRPAETFP